MAGAAPRQPAAASTARTWPVGRPRRPPRPEQPCERSLRLGDRGPAVFFADPVEPAVEAWDVRDAVQQLGVKYRVVLITVYFRGLSVQETADLLGLLPGTVKSRTHYASRHLRRALRGCGRTTTNRSGPCSRTTI